MTARRRRRWFVVGAGVALATLAGPAWAHVEVSMQPAQPGASDALATFIAASESTTAGITKLEFVADPAIPADQITLAEGPAGWKVGTGSLGGFVVEGPAVKAGEDAKVGVRIKQLPNAPQVVFKVLQSYSDGRIDRWINLPGPDGKEPEEFPALIVKLAAGAQSASATSETEASEAREAAEAQEQGAAGALAHTGPSGALILSGVGILLIGCGVILRARPRARGATNHL